MLPLLLLACTEPIADTAAEQVASATLLDGHESVVVISWDQPHEARVQVDYRVDGGEWRHTPARDVTEGLASQLLLGASFDAEVEWRLVRDDVAEPAQATRTGAAPEYLPDPTLRVDAPGQWDEATPWLLTSVHEHPSDWSSTWWVVVVDRAGQIVWAHRSEQPAAGISWVSRHVSLALEGDAVLVDRSTAWTEYDHGAASTVVSLTLDGEEHHTWTTPGLHHAFTPLPHGRLGYPARDGDDPDTEHLVEVDADDSLTLLWSCAPFWLAYAPEAESCGSNGLWWHAGPDRYLLSLWSLETVIEVDRTTREATRWFGHAEGSWSFVPEGSAFWWQHGPVYTDAGTLLVSSKVEEARETVVREYVLDEAHSTLSEIWSAGHGRGVYGSYGGDVTRLPGGNTLHGYGSAGQLSEFTPEGEVVWELAWEEGDRRIGQTTPIEDLYALAP